MANKKLMHRPKSKRPTLTITGEPLVEEPEGFHPALGSVAPGSQAEAVAEAPAIAPGPDPLAEAAKAAQEQSQVSLGETVAACQKQAEAQDQAALAAWKAELEPVIVKGRKLLEEINAARAETEPQLAEWNRSPWDVMVHLAPREAWMIRGLQAKIRTALDNSRAYPKQIEQALARYESRQAAPNPGEWRYRKYDITRPILGLEPAPESLRRTYAQISEEVAKVAAVVQRRGEETRARIQAGDPPKMAERPILAERPRPNGMSGGPELGAERSAFSPNFDPISR